MVDLILGLRELEIESVVIYPQEGPLSDKLKRLGIKGHCMNFSNCVHWKSNLPWWHPRKWISTQMNGFRALRKVMQNQISMSPIVKLVKELNPDLIITNTLSIDVGHKVAMRCNLPHIWHVREFGDLDWDFYPDFGLKRRRRVMKACKRVVFISQAVANYHSNQLGVSFNHQAVILHNGIASVNELQRRKEFRISRKDNNCELFTFVIIGHIKESKGQIDALKAFKSVLDSGSEARLVVVGHGAEDEFRCMVRDLELESKVAVLGHIDILDKIYQEASCGLMCSQAEGFGRVTAEFMSWGVPVIARDSGASPEIVMHERNGLLYDGSVASLSQAMARILSDHNLRDQLGLAAGLTAYKSFSSQRCAENFLTLVGPRD